MRVAGGPTSWDGAAVGRAYTPIVHLGRRVVLVGSLAVAALVVVVAFVALRNDGRSYSVAEVSAALNGQGLDVREVGHAGDEAALMPSDQSFTVLVLRSDEAARNSFRQYEGDTDPNTFELRARNVIILADFSNSETPLPASTRERIRRAVATLDVQSGT